MTTLIAMGTAESGWVVCLACGGAGDSHRILGAVAVWADAAAEGQDEVATGFALGLASHGIGTAGRFRSGRPPHGAFAALASGA